MNAMPIDIKAIIGKLTAIHKGGDVIGVDFGRSSVKIAKLKKAGDKYALELYGMIPVSSAAAGAEITEDEIDSTVKSVKAFLNSKAVKSGVGAVSVMGNFVIVRYVKFPKMANDELAKSLRFEAEEFIPFDITDVYLSTEIIKDIEEEGQPKMEAILVAAKKDIVDMRINMMKRIGIDPLVIDVDGFCVNNVYEHCYPDFAESNTMFLNLGASMTTLSIAEHGTVRVVRDIPFSGNGLTNLVMNTFASDFSQAEALKRQYGIVPSSEMETMSDAETAEQVTSALIQGVDEQLHVEMQRSIDYFNTISGSSEEISKIVLSGGGAMLKNLDKYLNRQMDIPVEVFNPLDFIEHPDDPELLKNASAYAVAIGLALRKAGDSSAIRAV
ncbi:MAG: type IV pilus assembly protein PilM [Candidatus Omnitrophica bacterium]|nr:type IV pilus assembly protein PilM [Candidatus Omnitrophota bacterium]